MTICDWRHHHVYATHILWSRRPTDPRRHNVIDAPIKHDDVEGILVSPSVYTTLRDLDRFGDAMGFAVKNGVLTS